MDIKQADFITSQTRYTQYPGMGLPEIALCGRSNVGKSSLINRLCRRNKLAKTSSTPGKTRMINLFLINGEMVLVDLPGYGFARVDKAEQQRWQGMIEGYFNTSGTLKRVLHLVDIRHDPTLEDQQLHAFLRNAGIPSTVVATKADKISRGQRMRYIAAICRGLQVQPWEVIPWSSEDETGREALLAHLEGLLGEAAAVAQPSQDAGLDVPQ